MYIDKSTESDLDKLKPAPVVLTASDCNKFTNNMLDAKITAKKLVNESGLNEKSKTLAIK